MKQGYIKIPREMRNDPNYYNHVFTEREAWLDLYLMANHKEAIVDNTKKKIPVQRGDVFTSQRKLARLWQWDKNGVKRYLVRQEKEGILGHKTNRDLGHGYTTITIKDYNRTQGNGYDFGTQNENVGTQNNENLGYKINKNNSDIPSNKERAGGNIGTQNYRKSGTNKNINTNTSYKGKDYLRLGDLTPEQQRKVEVF